MTLAIHRSPCHVLVTPIACYPIWGQLGMVSGHHRRSWPILLMIHLRFLFSQLDRPPYEWD